MQAPITPTENKEEYVKLIPTPDFETWLKIGIQEGYCTDRYCENHQVHAYEDEKLFHGLLEEYQARDFCWPVVRLRTLAEDE